MDKKLHTFLKSGLLDKYIIGSTTATESLEVKHYISTHKEVETEYNRLQNNLEILAKVNAVEPSKNILGNILKDLETTEGKPVITLSNSKRKTPWYAIAASVAAFVFGGYAFMLYQQNESLNRENQVVVDELFDLRSDIENNNSKLDDLARQLLKLNNPDAAKYVLRGNERAKNLKTVAYINSVEKTLMIDVVNLPQLPEDQYYQIWAELQDRMVNLGILDESERKLKPIPYMEDALALSITIEQKNGINEFENSENEVAEVSLKDN